MNALTRSLRVRARGFTLLELAVSIALGVIVIGTAAAVLATVLRDNRRARIHSELQRDAELASQLLAQEVRQAGLGVPTGHHVSENCNASTGVCNYIYGTGSAGTANELRFLARAILVAGTAELGILGDLPRPDSNYNAFGPLHSRGSASNADGSNGDGIAWHTENNGTCMPPGCSTSSTSLFFPGAGDCTGGTALTCPWASRRIAPGEPIQIVDGGGNWGHSAASAPFALATGMPTGATGLRLAFRYDQGVPRRWPNNGPGAGPAGLIGQGWVTTLDRVFYRLSTTTPKRLERRQCWGDPDPGHAAWPPHTSNAIPVSPGSVVPPVSGGVTINATVCTPFETIARNVDSLTFTYADAAGTTLTSFPDGDSKNAIRSVAWTLVLKRPDGSGRDVSYTIQGATRIEN